VDPSKTVRVGPSQTMTHAAGIIGQAETSRAALRQRPGGRLQPVDQAFSAVQALGVGDRPPPDLQPRSPAERQQRPDELTMHRIDTREAVVRGR
jgi:hypothetical protein